MPKYNHYIIGQSNEFTSELKSWVKLTSYGLFPHPRGVQEISIYSAHQVVRAFKCLASSLARVIRPTPVYIGHPDDDDFKNKPGHTDATVYGFVDDVKDDDQGLWAKIEWTPEGKDLVQKKIYRYLSPRWTMRSIHTDVFEPKQLLSLGLTNRPNLPGQTIANASLLTVAPVIKTETLTTGLNANTSSAGTQQHFLNLVEQHMHSTGSSYVSSWSAVKKNKPELYSHL